MSEKVMGTAALKRLWAKVKTALEGKQDAVEDTGWAALSSAVKWRRRGPVVSVHMSGGLSASTDSWQTLSQRMPEGARPAEASRFPIHDDDGSYGVCFVGADGALQLKWGYLKSGADGTFYADFCYLAG